MRIVLTTFPLAGKDLLSEEFLTSMSLTVKQQEKTSRLTGAAARVRRLPAPAPLVQEHVAWKHHYMDGCLLNHHGMHINLCLHERNHCQKIMLRLALIPALPNYKKTRDGEMQLQNHRRADCATMYRS